jgi:predicted GIY-YIG superfamily endonuclease
MADSKTQTAESPTTHTADETPWYVYIVRCADDTLYTGATNDVDRRIATHNASRGAKYTRTRLPVVEVYRERCPNKSAALSREQHIKHLSRSQKLALIEA